MTEPTTETKPIRKCRILIVDDHPLMREGLCRLVESEPDLSVWGQAGNAADARLLLEDGAPDVAVVDIVLPGITNGIQLTSSIRAVRPEVKVLILSMHDDVTYMERAYRAGAKGYVTKMEVASVMLDAIRTVWSGGEYFTRPFARQAGETPEGSADVPAGWGMGKVSGREMEVVELIGRGFVRRQIAERLGISVKTVEAHREHIRRKLGLRSASDLTRYSIKWCERRAGSGPA